METYIHAHTKSMKSFEIKKYFINILVDYYIYSNSIVIKNVIMVDYEMQLL